MYNQVASVMYPSVMVSRAVFEDNVLDFKLRPGDRFPTQAHSVRLSNVSGSSLQITLNGVSFTDFSVYDEGSSVVINCPGWSEGNQQTFHFLVQV
jgi:hypothetical protein